MAINEELIKDGKIITLDRKVTWVALFQLIAWAVYMFGFFVGAAVRATIKSENDNIYKILLFSSLGLCLGLLVIGSVISYNNGSSVLNVVLMLFFFASLGTVSISSSALNTTSDLYFYGFPFVITSALHLLWAFTRPQRPFSVVFSTIVMTVASFSPIISNLLHKAKYDSSSNVVLEYFLTVILFSVFSASWISCYKQVLQLTSMSNGHHFFFIFSGTFIFGLVFFIGISILPLVCGLRYMCLKVKEPQPPEKPTPPQRPNKPQEPSIGAKPNEWNEYRKKLTKYKKEKKEFKEDSEYYKKNQTQLMIAYEKMRYKHRKIWKIMRQTLRVPPKLHFVPLFIILLST